MKASNYSKKKKKGPDNGISGPLALASELDADPVSFPPPTFSLPPPRRDQHPSRPQSSNRTRDAPRYGSPPSDVPEPYNHPNNTLNAHHTHEQPLDLAVHVNARHDNTRHDNDRHDNHRHDTNTHKNNSADFYDDGFVHEFYGGSTESIGAQQPPVKSHVPSKGNQTPAPEYYLGKEDIDPRRDLRGLERPETYLKINNPPQPSAPPASAQQTPAQQESSSPRSSCSSEDGESGYLTLEQAQKAHQRKMMGHKESIGSGSIMMERYGQQHQHQAQQPNPIPLAQLSPTFVPEHASIAISDSTMSMMPSLPSIASPASLTPRNKISLDQGSRILQSGRPSHTYDDPYDGADLSDNRSYASTPRHGPYGGSGGAARPFSPPASQYAPNNAYNSAVSSPRHYPQQGGGYRPNGPGPTSPTSPGPNSPGYGAAPPYNSGYNNGYNDGYNNGGYNGGYNG
ncbi:hypothetical protein BGX34_005826, partial [Mortierella sp. NVP85]